VGLLDTLTPIPGYGGWLNEKVVDDTRGCGVLPCVRGEKYTLADGRHGWMNG